MKVWIGAVERVRGGSDFRGDEKVLLKWLSYPFFFGKLYIWGLWGVGLKKKGTGR